MPRAIVLSGVIAASLVATPARAAPDDLVGRPLVLDAGQLDAQLVIDANLYPGRALEPISVSPDVWWGVSQRWTIGVIHSNLSVDRFEPGATFCLRTESSGGSSTVSDIGCQRLYHGSGLDVWWSARTGHLAISPRARLVIRDVDPWKPALLVGAAVRWTRGRFAISGDPYLQLGLANTDRGNRAELWLPVELAMQPTCRWEIVFDTGFNSAVSILRDGGHVPIAFGGRARATEHLDVGATFGFASLLGPQVTSKDRSMFVVVGWRS